MVQNEWQRLKNRCVWSWSGWRAAWASEPSLRSWVYANILSALLAFVLPLSTAERSVILMGGLMVLAVELINTAIERTVDYISTEQHPIAGEAKDIGSAGVAVAAIAVGVAWVVVLVG